MIALLTAGTSNIDFEELGMSQRKSVVVPELAHRFPVPNASRIGNLIMSGSITGVDPSTKTFPEGLPDQCANMFANMRSIVEAAGATTDDIIKVDIFIVDRNEREPLNAEWVCMFPNPDSRPTRHARLLTVEGGSLIQCSFVAYTE
jgi:2-iminobutanoate/2-iminopropanoate deaminase